MTDAERPLAGCRILFVEDEYLIATIMAEWLARAGAQVIGPVPSVEQALATIDGGEDSFDAAVLDVNLGEGQTAYPVADRLDELGVPFLFATGEVRVRDGPAYQQRPVLTKPIARTKLLAAVERLLRTPPSRSLN